MVWFSSLDVYLMKYVAEMSEASSSMQSHAELLALEWWTVEEFRQHGCYGRLAVVSDLDGGGFALNVDKELRGSAVL
jgi:hypothetical protein